MEDLEWLSDYVVGFMKSSTWVVPIAQFVDDHCGLFDDEMQGGENKLEYTACHKEFGQLVGDLLAAHLLEVSVTTEMFDHFCQQGLSESQELHRVLIEQLLAVDDFLTFKAMMAKHNALLYREVMTLDADGTFEGEEPMSPTREVASQLIKDALGISEWRLYEEQLFSNSAEASSEEDLEALRRCEEAELQHAIALSLQLEEERMRSEGAEAPLLAAPELPPGAGHRSAPLCSYVPLSLQIAQDAAPQPPTESPPAPAGEVQHLMRVEPLTAAPLRPPNPEVQALRQRAERALAPLSTGPNSPSRRLPPSFQPLAGQPSFSSQAPLPPTPLVPTPVPANVALAAATAAAQSAGGPSAEQRRQRAEHLRNQRDRLLQKRRNDRGQELTQAIAAAGGSHVAAAVDRALQTSGTAAAGRRLVSELTPQPAAPAPPANAAAEQMRQALTVQLRQNLARSAGGASTQAGLTEQLDRLERLQAGECS